MATATAKRQRRSVPDVIDVREYFSGEIKKDNLDRENAIVKNVKLMGFESQNRRSYKPDAVRKAVQLYEGSLAFVNHPPKQDLLRPRGYDERFGVFRNVHVVEGSGLHGDLHYNPKHLIAEQFLWDVEHNSQRIGFSPNHSVRVSRAGGREVVEGILGVRSVDLVNDPATTRTVFEGTEPIEESDMTFDPATLTLEQLSERADLKEAIIREYQASESARRDAQEFADLKGKKKQFEDTADELTKLRTENAEFKKREEKAAHDKLVSEMLDESTLDRRNKTIVSDNFIESLAGLPKEQIEARIRDREALTKAASAGNVKPKSRPQHLGEGAQADFGTIETSEQFVAALGRD